MPGDTTSDKGPSLALVWGLRVTLGAIGLLAALKFIAGAPIEAATVGLAVAAGALIFCLSALYKMVRALARPAVDFDLEQETHLALAGHKRLRDDRRRLLRAINELKFDHEMGKLSEADYKSVRHSYELRAVEVMRALENEPGLHPALVKELQRRGIVDEPVADDDDADDGEIDEVDDSAEDDAAGDTSSADAQPALRKQPPAPEKSTIECAACNKAVSADAKFCKHCGEELSA